jgi:hypothetical protein
MYSPKRHSLFGPILRARRMSALFRAWSTVRARGRRVSFVYLTSPLLCGRRQAFLSVFCSVSGLVCGKGYGVPGVFLLSLVYERRRTLSFICWFPGESDFAHIIVYNMLSPFVSRELFYKSAEAAIFLIFKIFYKKIVETLFVALLALIFSPVLFAKRSTF